MAVVSFIIHMRKIHKTFFWTQTCISECLLDILTWISHRHLKSQSETNLLASSLSQSLNLASGTQLAKLKYGCHPLSLPLPHAIFYPRLLNIVLKIKTKTLKMPYKALHFLALICRTIFCIMFTLDHADDITMSLFLFLGHTFLLFKDFYTYYCFSQIFIYLIPSHPLDHR